MDAPYTIIGEVNGVPIKRYSARVRGDLPKQQPLSQQAKLRKFSRLSPWKKAAAFQQQAADKAEHRQSKLKAQRLKVLGNSRAPEVIREAHTLSVRGDTALHTQDRPGERQA